MGNWESYNTSLGDPHIAFAGKWDTLDSDSHIHRADGLLVSAMEAFLDGTYRDVADACAHLGMMNPAEGYVRSAKLLADLPLQRFSGQIIKGRKDGLTELIALSDRQASALRTQLTIGNLLDDYALLANTNNILEEQLRQDASLESLDWDHVPRERQLFLFGSTHGENFRYTLARAGNRLTHDLLTRNDPLDKLAAEYEGAARYVVSNIPSYASRKVEELRRFLLGAYASIKKQVSREGLSHYPLLFAENS